MKIFHYFRNVLAGNDTKDFFYNLGGSLAYNGINFIIRLILIRALSQQQYGVYTSITNFYIAISYFFINPISFICYPKIAYFRSSQSPNKLISFISSVFVFEVLLLLFLMALIICFDGLIIKEFFGGHSQLFREPLNYGCALLLLLFTEQIYVFFIALESFKKIFYYRISFLLQILFMVVTIIIYPSPHKGINFIICTWVTYLIALSPFVIKFAKNFFLDFYLLKDTIREVAIFIPKFSLVSFFETWAVVLCSGLLLRYGSIEAVGIFGAFYIFKQILFFSVSMPLNFFLSKVINNALNGLILKAKRYFEAALIYTCMISLSLCILFLLAKNFWMKILLGDFCKNTSLLITVLCCSFIDNVIYVLTSVFKAFQKLFSKLLLQTLWSFIAFSMLAYFYVVYHNVDASNMFILITLSNLIGTMVYIVCYRKLIISLNWLKT